MMRVAVLSQYGKIEILEKKRPIAHEKNEVLIKIRATGICGTDIHGYQGTHATIKPPRIMGHEISGEVMETGPEVTSFKRGDRVVVDPVISCGQCYACLQGRNNICTTVRCLGVHVDGGFSDFIKVSAENLYKISDEISWEHAAMIEPFSIAAHVCERSEVKPGEKAVIIGAGQIGLCILQAFDRIGVDVLVVDIVESRLNKAEEMGAKIVVNSKRKSFESEVLAFTHGHGASLVIEGVGNPFLLEEAVKITSHGARIIVMGFSSNQAKIPEVEITQKELEIRGSRLNCRKFPQAIKWFENNEVHPELLISRTYHLNDIDKAFKEIIKNPKDNIKVIIKN